MRSWAQNFPAAALAQTAAFLFGEGKGAGCTVAGLPGVPAPFCGSSRPWQLHPLASARGETGIQAFVPLTVGITRESGWLV